MSRDLGYLKLHVAGRRPDYLQAATTLCGAAGRYAVEEYRRLNSWLFSGEMPPLPVIVAHVAWGRCIGLTQSRGTWGDFPRITLPPETFQGSRLRPDGAPGRLAGGRNQVTDVLTHEMCHARLMLDGKYPSHDGKPWCALIAALSPKVLGHEISAAPVYPRKVDGGRKARVPKPGHLDQMAIAGWPGSLRPEEWDPGERIYVDGF